MNSYHARRYRKACNIFIIAQVVSGAKKIDMILVLCFSFLFQAIISPTDLFNVGFMFSYGALFGILPQRRQRAC